MKEINPVRPELYNLYWLVDGVIRATGNEDIKDLELNILRNLSPYC